MTFLLAFCILSALVTGYVTFWSPKPHAYFYNRKPLYFAHRGALHHEPENTLVSFNSAVDLKMPALEIDVISTKDGVVVCSHNFDLERETDGAGYIDEQDFSDLQELNAAVNWDNKFHSIPKLANLVKAIPNDVILDIEIKIRGIWDFKTARPLVRLVREHKIGERTIISSFNPLVLKLIKLLDKGLYTAFNVQDQKWIKWTNWIHPDFLHPEFGLVNEDLVRFAKERGLGVNVWTVNSKPAIEWLTNLGVDGIITDRPEFCNV